MQVGYQTKNDGTQLVFALLLYEMYARLTCNKKREKISNMLHGSKEYEYKIINSSMVKNNELYTTVMDRLIPK